MRKKSKKKYETLSRCFPLLFWKKCDRCHDSFRWEWGWSALTGPYYNGCGRWRYLCKECAPDSQAASDYFYNLHKMKYPPGGTRSICPKPSREES